MTALYSGDANFGPDTSNAVAELVEDFNFTLTSTSAGNVTTVPGQTAVFAFNIAPVAGPFDFPIALSATGLPAGATVTFSPATITLGSAGTAFTMTIQTPATAQLRRQELWRGGGTVAFAVLLLPFGLRIRRPHRGLRMAIIACFTLLGLGAAVGLTGCGSGSGFFGQTQKSYTITILGTATSGSATLQHSATVTLTVE